MEIQSNIIAGTLELDSEKVLEIVKKYTLGLEMLDSYDHQTISKPKLTTHEIYKLTYDAYYSLDKFLKLSIFNAFSTSSKEAKALLILPLEYCIFNSF